MNMDRVASLNADGVVVRSGVSVPISRTYRAQFRKGFADYLAAPQHQPQPGV